MVRITDQKRPLGLSSSLRWMRQIRLLRRQNYGLRISIPWARIAPELNPEAIVSSALIDKAQYGSDLARTRSRYHPAISMRCGCRHVSARDLA